MHASLDARGRPREYDARGVMCPHLPRRRCMGLVSIRRGVACAAVVMGMAVLAPAARAAVRPYGGLGTTSFHGHGVPEPQTGVGISLGVDATSHPFGIGVRADLSHLGAGVNRWVQLWLVDLRVLFADETKRWRPYLEGDVGGGAAKGLEGSPGYAFGGGGG